MDLGRWEEGRERGGEGGEALFRIYCMREESIFIKIKLCNKINKSNKISHAAMST